MIADTTLLVDLLQDVDGARGAVEEIEAGGEVLWLPGPALFELWEGVERADRPDDERQRIQEVVQAYTVLPFTPEHAARAGRISGQLIRRGRMIDPVDAQIAGTALEEELAVLTRDTDDFGRVPELDVRSY